jgi:hypothetical protein
VNIENTQWAALGGIITLVSTVLLPSMKQTIVAIIVAVREKDPHENDSPKS